MFSQERWEIVLANTISKVRTLAALKGDEYAGDQQVDRLKNFRTIAAQVNAPMELVWFVYTSKHWHALTQYIDDVVNKRSRTRMEPIEGRAEDIIVYLILFLAMVEERKSEIEAIDNGG